MSQQIRARLRTRSREAQAANSFAAVPFDELVLFSFSDSFAFANQHYGEDHAHLLASKWLSATKLNELTKTIGKSSFTHVGFLYRQRILGLQYKKGKFSASEEALLRNAIENYRVVCILFFNGAYATVRLIFRNTEEWSQP